MSGAVLTLFRLADVGGEGGMTCFISTCPLERCLVADYSPLPIENTRTLCQAGHAGVWRCGEE